MIKIRTAYSKILLMSVGLCSVFLLGGAFYISRKEKNMEKNMKNNFKTNIGDDIEQVKFNSVIIPEFMKTKEENKIDWLDDDDGLTIVDLDAEMPVKPRISPNKPSIDIKTYSDTAGVEKPLIEPLTDAEKESIRGIAKAMAKDKRQVEIMLEEFPMDVIIKHFDKEWAKAEAFKNDVEKAFGGILKK